MKKVKQKQFQVKHFVKQLYYLCRYSPQLTRGVGPHNFKFNKFALCSVYLKYTFITMTNRE